MRRAYSLIDDQFYRRRFWRWTIDCRTATFQGSRQHHPTHRAEHRIAMRLPMHAKRSWREVRPEAVEREVDEERVASEEPEEQSGDHICAAEK